MSYFSQWQALTAVESVQEALFTGLRLKNGVSLIRLAEIYSADAIERALDLAALLPFWQAGLLYLHTDSIGCPTFHHLALTPAGWSRLNGILKQLLRPYPSYAGAERGYTAP
jgi:coproporphyrinogen III oxidase-like Fe-S oxidoreductase